MVNTYLNFKREREEAHTAMVKEFNALYKSKIENDKTGEGFIADMFGYELANHEYMYTGEIEPALSALGLTIEEVNKDRRLIAGLKKAISSI